MEMEEEIMRERESNSKKKGEGGVCWVTGGRRGGKWLKQ